MIMISYFVMFNCYLYILNIPKVLGNNYNYEITGSNLFFLFDYAQGEKNGLNCHISFFWSKTVI